MDLPNPPYIIADVTLLPKGVGRNAAIFDGYRPPMFIEDREEGNDCAPFLYGKSYQPGESFTAPFIFACPWLVWDLIKIGTKFRLAEGRKTVATGIITEIAGIANIESLRPWWFPDPRKK